MFVLSCANGLAAIHHAILSPLAILEPGIEPVVC
jgi:hypothetical protein